METRDKRFQSGREVMATYIPGYSEGDDAFDSRLNLGAASGGLVGAALLGEFAKSLNMKMPTLSSVRPLHRGGSKMCK